MSECFCGTLPCWRVKVRLHANSDSNSPNHYSTYYGASTFYHTGVGTVPVRVRSAQRIVAHIAVQIRAVEDHRDVAYGTRSPSLPNRGDENRPMLLA